MTRGRYPGVPELHSVNPRSRLLRLAIGPLVAASGLVSVAMPTGTPAALAAPSADQAVVVVLEGQGNGHGRGLSQWGSYGWATAYGKDWTWILDHYYGGTVMGTAGGDQRMTVRLLDLDGAFTSVVAPTGDASVNGTGAYASVTVRLVSVANQFDAWGSASPLCPSPTADLGSATPSIITVPDGPIARGSTDRNAVRQIQVFLTQASVVLGVPAMNPGGTDGLFGPMTENSVKAFQTTMQAQGSFAGLVDGVWGPDTAAAARLVIPQLPVAATGTWAYLGRFPLASNGWGIRIATPSGDLATTSPDTTLGVCQANGSVRHYRGAIVAAYAGGTNTPQRTINDVPVEQYLRGVVPRESPASWGDAAGGAGINALRAQSVAARSYGLAQNRYTYAKSCDSDSCQVYGGAATRPSATGGATILEDARTDRAIVDSAGVIRVRSDNPTAPVSTEFSSSNGDRTAGGAFTSVDDPGDMIDANPWNRWTRVLDASALAGRYGLSSITGATNENDPLSINRGWQGMWALQTRLMSGSSSTVVSHATLRSAYDLPSIAFTVRVVKRDVVLPDDFLFIGDSVGESIAARSQSGELPSLLSGVFASSYYDALTNRCTVGACVANQFDGLGVAQNAPGTPDIAVVALGYNDSGSAMAGEIDQLMTALVNRGVRLVGWVNLSQRRTSNGSPTYARHNEALRAAVAKWPQLRVLDWNGASSLGPQSRWYSDGVHLTTSGQAQYALWLRDRIIEMVAGIEQTRVFGDDRYLTAVQISSEARSAGAITGGEVVIVNGTGTVDGLAAAGFAGARRAAILLTRADALPGDVAAHLQSLNPSRVTIVGGVNAVMPAVLDQIRAIVPAAVVERVEGADRYLTAQALARTVLADAPVLYIASGQSQVDALSIAPAAYAQADPLLLSTPLGLDDSTQVAVREWWAANPTGRVVIVGGTSAIGSGLEKQLLFFGIPANKTTRLNGKDRYETSAAAVAWVRSNVTGFASGSIGIASGQSPIDSLTSSPLLAGGAVRSPLLLVPPCGAVPATTKTVLASVTRQYVIGGPGAVCDALALALKQR